MSTHSPHNIVVHLCSPPNTTKSNLSPTFLTLWGCSNVNKLYLQCTCQEENQVYTFYKKSLDYTLAKKEALVSRNKLLQNHSSNFPPHPCPCTINNHIQHERVGGVRRHSCKIPMKNNSYKSTQSWSSRWKVFTPDRSFGVFFSSLGGVCLFVLHLLGGLFFSPS